MDNRSLVASLFGGDLFLDYLGGGLGCKAVLRIHGPTIGSNRFQKTVLIVDRLVIIDEDDLH